MDSKAIAERAISGGGLTNDDIATSIGEPIRGMTIAPAAVRLAALDVVLRTATRRTAYLKLWRCQHLSAVPLFNA